MQMKIRDFAHKNRFLLSVPIDHIQSGLPKSTSFLAAIMCFCYCFSLFFKPCNAKQKKIITIKLLARHALENSRPRDFAILPRRVTWISTEHKKQFVAAVNGPRLNVQWSRRTVFSFWRNCIDIGIAVGFYRHTRCWEPNIKVSSQFK